MCKAYLVNMLLNKAVEDKQTILCERLKGDFCTSLHGEFHSMPFVFQKAGLRTRCRVFGSELWKGTRKLEHAKEENRFIGHLPTGSAWPKDSQDLVIDPRLTAQVQPGPAGLAQRCPGLRAEPAGSRLKREDNSP